MSASAWALDWYNELPSGPCRLAVTRFLEERGRAGASPEEALTESLAYAQQHFPEVVLWTLDRGVVPNPWLNDSVRLGIRSSLLALRQLREERAIAEQAAAAALAEAVPAQQADAVAPFTGARHRLGD